MPGPGCGARDGLREGVRMSAHLAAGPQRGRNTGHLPGPRPDRTYRDGGVGGCPGRRCFSFSAQLPVCLARWPIGTGPVGSSTQPASLWGGGEAPCPRHTSAEGSRGRLARIPKQHSASQLHKTLPHHQRVGFGAESHAGQLPAHLPPREPAPKQQHVPWEVAVR